MQFVVAVISGIVTEGCKGIVALPLLSGPRIVPQELKAANTSYLQELQRIQINGLIDQLPPGDKIASFEVGRRLFIPGRREGRAKGNSAVKVVLASGRALVETIGSIKYTACHRTVLVFIDAAIVLRQADGRPADDR